MRPIFPRRFLLYCSLPLLSGLAVVGLSMARGWDSSFHAVVGKREAVRGIQPTHVEEPAQVWLVESNAEWESYSNGLRVETAHTVVNEPRRNQKRQIGETAAIVGQENPAGIVFHTTESHIAPFEESHNRRLQRVGQWVREYVTQNRSYHYLVDRFGRVHRIVRDSDAAYHAGVSVWGSGDKVWLNLNQSYLGVALESKTQAGETASDSVTAGQIRALAMLTEMLRSRYAIDAANCVTHAQVSLNPVNMRLGLHTDWGANFPFAEVGLPDNYGSAPAAIANFGFVADASFVAATGERLRRGIEQAEQVLSRRAGASRMDVNAYRMGLQRQFRTATSAMVANANKGEGMELGLESHP